MKNIFYWCANKKQNIIYKYTILESWDVSCVTVGSVHAHDIRAADSRGPMFKSSLGHFLITLTHPYWPFSHAGKKSQNCSCNKWIASCFRYTLTVTTVWGYSASPKSSKPVRTEITALCAVCGWRKRCIGQLPKKRFKLLIIRESCVEMKIATLLLMNFNEGV